MVPREARSGTRRELVMVGPEGRQHSIEDSSLLKSFMVHRLARSWRHGPGRSPLHIQPLFDPVPLLSLLCDLSILSVMKSLASVLIGFERGGEFLHRRSDDGDGENAALGRGIRSPRHRRRAHRSTPADPRPALAIFAASSKVGCVVARLLPFNFAGEIASKSLNAARITSARISSNPLVLSSVFSG